MGERDERIVRVAVQGKNNTVLKVTRESDNSAKLSCSPTQSRNITFILPSSFRNRVHIESNDDVMILKNLMGNDTGVIICQVFDGDNLQEYTKTLNLFEEKAVNSTSCV